LKEYDALVSIFVLGDKEVKRERIMRSLFLFICSS